MPDLTTSYLGLKLRNPLVASASVLSKKNERVIALEEAGIGAVVMYSLFEEEIEHESKALNHFLTANTYSYWEALTYFPDFERYNIGPEKYLDQITALKKKVKIPIIASLNGVSYGGWTGYAKRMEEAGADALELNIYYLPVDQELDSSTLESAYCELVQNVRNSIKIPMAVKLSPFFTTLPSIVRKLEKAGANGVVLFNRFYQPVLNIEELNVAPHLELSTSSDNELPLRWIALLYGRVEIDLALTSGVHTAADIIKGLMAGAKVTMMASELISSGIPRVQVLLNEVQDWMKTHEYPSVTKMIGILSQQKVPEPDAFERANYMKALTLFDNRLH